jgi:hypothetical protein
MNTIPLLETYEGEVLVRGVQTPKRSTRAGWTTWASKLLFSAVLVALTMLAVLDKFSPFSSIAVLVLTPVFVFGIPRRRVDSVVWYEHDLSSGTTWEVRE